jgi:hypothetical protein
MELGLIDLQALALDSGYSPESAAAGWIREAA